MVSLHQLHREKDQNCRLVGSKCTKCGTVNFPQRHTCYQCAGQEFTEVVLQRRGKVVTFTKQYYVPQSFDAPHTMAIAEMEGGGRIMTHMTDYEPDQVQIDMEVELVPRKFSDEDGKVLYGWAFRPVAGGSGPTSDAPGGLPVVTSRPQARPPPPGA